METPVSRRDFLTLTMPEKIGTAEINVDYAKLAENIQPYLDLQSGPEWTEEEIALLIEKHAQTGTGDFGDLRDRLETLVNKLELSVYPDHEWTVGPETPSGSYHSTPLWGLHFSTDRYMRLGKAVINANQPAEFTVRLYRFEGGEIKGVEDDVTISANGNEQEVVLDLHAGPGEYLLARPIPEGKHDAEVYQDLPPEAFVDEPVGCAIRRVLPSDHSQSNFEEYSKHGVTFYGADHPTFSNNSGYYYFFDMEVATGPESQEG